MLRQRPCCRNWFYTPTTLMRKNKLSNGCSLKRLIIWAQGVWQRYEQQGYEAVKNIDFTKWQHDLYRPGGRFPYDPAEIEIIKHLGKLADEGRRGETEFKGEDFA